MRKSTAKVIKFPEQRRRYLDVKIADAEIRTLKQIVEYEGLSQIANDIGISEMTLLRVCAGWIDRCNVDTRQKVLAFFGEGADKKRPS